MMCSHVSPGALNLRWGYLSSSIVFVHHSGSVSSLASCLVTGTNIRCLMYKKSHKAQV